jgi:hypothetical protein
MKTLITSLQKDMDDGDFRGLARCAYIHGGNDSFANLPFKIPPYNGKYDPAASLDWELAVEQKFSCHDLPASSQVITAISAFTDLALHWWHYEQKNPTSTTTCCAELKAAMRRRFVPSYYARNAERENIGNVHGATLMEGENCVNILNFSTAQTMLS